MKKRISSIIIYIFISFSIFSNENIFKPKQNFTLNDKLNHKDYQFEEDDFFTQSTDNGGIGVDIENPLKIVIRLHSNKYDKNMYIPIENVYLDSNLNAIPKNINKDYWIPSYYYDLLKSNNIKNDILKYEPYWKNFKNSTEDYIATWFSFIGIQRYYFSDYYFVIFGNRGYNNVDFLAYLEKVSDREIVYNVQEMYSNSFNYLKKNLAYPNQPEFLPLYEKATPFKVIFTIDGDYMNMYIDEISEKNLFQTLVRTTPEACDQIENFILGKSKDLSKVVMPKHGNNSATTTSSSRSQPSTNVSPNKLMSVTENLKLRSGEATTTSVLTVMQAGTKVKILELGKAETIDGIDSNWVKVEVQKGSKDRNGKEIKSGTTGWCYGGYLK